MSFSIVVRKPEAPPEGLTGSLKKLAIAVSVEGLLDGVRSVYLFVSHSGSDFTFASIVTKIISLISLSLPKAKVSLIE